MDGGGQKKNLEGREAVAKKKWEVGEVVTCQKEEKESTQVEKYTAGQVPVRFPDHSFMAKIERTT